MLCTSYLVQDVPTSIRNPVPKSQFGFNWPAIGQLASSSCRFPLPGPVVPTSPSLLQNALQTPHACSCPAALPGQMLKAHGYLLEVQLGMHLRPHQADHGQCRAADGRHWISFLASLSMRHFSRCSSMARANRLCIFTSAASSWLPWVRSGFRPTQRMSALHRSADNHWPTCNLALGLCKTCQAFHVVAHCSPRNLSRCHRRLSISDVVGKSTPFRRLGGIAQSIRHFSSSVECRTPGAATTSPVFSRHQPRRLMTFAQAPSLSGRPMTVAACFTAASTLACRRGERRRAIPISR
jgi:hypothetical protein